MKAKVKLTGTHTHGRIRSCRWIKRETNSHMSDELRGVESVTIDGQQQYGEQRFPLVLQWSVDRPSMEMAVEWLGQQRYELEEKLTISGAILFRGFPVRSPEDFDRFVAAFDFENFPYDESLSNAVRVNYTPRVFSANEAPADIAIYLHHEMAQTPIYPTKLLFYCQQPADAGGATPLCRSDVLFEQMLDRLPEFTKQCESKGLKYSNVMPSADDAASGMGRSWQSTFRAESRSEAEHRMHELGYTWQWLEEDCLRVTTPELPAVREISPGRKVFFNQLIAAFRGWKDSRNDPSKSITFGDGTPLDREEVLQVADLAEKLTFDIPWQQGDVALVDNYLVMHGRRTFRGVRKVLASLVAAARHG